MPNSKKTILVVGGAGYIGSHMVLALTQAGFQPVVLDNLCKGHRHAVVGAKLVEGDMGDKGLLANVFDEYQVTAVMHFGGFIEVGESVKWPGKYYQNNTAATLNLLEVMREKNVRKMIFSSTAAVYGEPLYTPIDEKHPLAPINPYGTSKWMVERMLQDYAKSDGLQFAILRYFNAAGADPAGQLGECHEPESHLIPLVLQVAAGKREAITVYGQDYPTPDGTCVRDYIHVTDLCVAHLLALEALETPSASYIYNLGNGQGYSVQQVIEAARRITGHAIPVREGERRQGDPAVLVADATRAKQELLWEPKYSALDTIIQHAWNFYCQQNAKEKIAHN